MEEDFWTAWQAASKLLPARLPPAFLHGMTGGAFRSRACPLLKSDLEDWLLPGLPFVGIKPTLLPLSSETSDWLSWMRASLRRRVPVSLYGFDEVHDTTEPAALERSASGNTTRLIETSGQSGKEGERLQAPNEDAPLLQQALATSLDARKNNISIKESDGSARVLRLENVFLEYSHALVLEKAPFRRSREEHARFALRQWTAFACACPERVIGSGAVDAEPRGLSADFWRGLAGKECSAAATRLRRLAALFEDAPLTDFFPSVHALLYGYACIGYALPAPVEDALLASANSILSDSERRELIYLCRAGTRDLKIFAAYRLHHEREFADARSTLEQLRYSADAWVKRMGSTP